MTYSFMDDFAAGYDLACRMLALRHGSVRFHTIEEMYWLEAQGLVP